MKFAEILTKYRESSFSEQDKGVRFERLMQAYLQTDPKYTSKIRQVWLWNEFPARSELGEVDTGIDLVAETYTGEYWAIQCKCYDHGTTIDKPDVDTFISTSGREFHFAGKVTSFALRVWISTSDRWTQNAENAIKGQKHPAVTRINLHDLSEAPVDWEKLEKGIHGDFARTAKYVLLGHQEAAFNKAHEYFQHRERGKLIMACGTGKTFTALRIAEKESVHTRLILFCVPSIALLGQTLREWTAHSQEALNTICICSDPRVTQARQRNLDSGGFSTIDLTVPATTNPKRVFEQYEAGDPRLLTVIFSTYQSIDVVEKAQKLGLPNFDIIICDEAHRTTGVTLKDEKESSFVRIHDNSAIKGSLRLYMTATPRLYAEETRARAKEAYAEICSMDDEELYGAEIYHIGFGEAVEKGLLSDYKVLIFTVSENDVPPAIQEALSTHGELPADAPAKLIGCINALSKQIMGDTTLVDSDPLPMTKAVAFCQNIQNSKEISKAFNDISKKYMETLAEERRGKIIGISSDHIDGTMSAPTREHKLSWLKEQSETARCKVLSNVRCLSEGVDVPALDAVLFLAAKNSQIDVVQSVGRVMRKSPNKRYGYIVIPIVVPSTVDPEAALDENARYRVVWSVLNALRAHDERFNATINKIDLNKRKPDSIIIGGVPNDSGEYGDDETGGHQEQGVLSGWEKFTQLQSAIYARLVKKVGSRQYWEQWAQSVARIAERQIERITALSKHDACKDIFADFVTSLKTNINNEITAQDAVEMLSQHIITAPVFDALFEGYEFAKNNAVSVEMNAMLELLSEYDAFEDMRELEKFYESVRKRAEGIDNAEGKQRVIIELYNTFFKTAFPKMTERLGIVYTPVEVVDFIVRSVNDVLQAEFGRGLGSENVNILDPFTGTGTFISRLLQSGIIAPTDLEYKYKREIFANEIVLLAYYISAVNIENAFHDVTSSEDYTPFEGICLTDTFQLGEGNVRMAELFPANAKRLERQRNAPITVIMGNPPYSVGQRSANDNAQNTAYPSLDEAIKKTYAALSDSTNKNALYDSYIRAFRWATDRLCNGDGIIGFVSNGAWLDGNSTAGFRKSLEREFSKIYVFNLRGNQRTSGETSRREGGKIFGSGSRTPVAITLLVKRSGFKGKAEIYYRDIGDYLKREQKLATLRAAGSFLDPAMPEMTRLSPNIQGDWITERNEAFATYIPLAPDKKFDTMSESLFVVNSRGFETARDTWVYNFSETAVRNNMHSMVEFYNACVDSGEVRYDNDKIAWSSSLLSAFERKDCAEFEAHKIKHAMYRPFNKEILYYGDKMIHRRGQFDEFFPAADAENLLICVNGVGGSKDFSCLITNTFTDIQCLFNGQCFPLYYYSGNPQKAQVTMFDAEESTERYVRKDAISDWIARRAREQYGAAVKKEDIFYYVYGYLHAPAYRETFAADLKKTLPRIPLVEKPDDFWKFSKAGRELAMLHLRYEEIAPLDTVEVKGKRDDCRVTKMRFPDKGRKDTILYNEHIRVENIPTAAYKYVVNGKSAIEWVMDRYRVTTDRASGIVNDPNLYAEECGKPTYILDLLLSIIAVSVRTVEVVRKLPVVEI